MDQSGDAPEAEQPATPLPPPTLADAPPPERRRDGRGFVIAGILGLVAIVGLVAWMARPDDGLAELDRQEERFPTPTTLPPPTTPPPATTVAPTVLATVPATGPPTAVPGTTASVVAPPSTPAPTAPPTTAPPTTAATATTTVAGLPGDPTPSAAPDPTIPLPPDDPEYIARLVPSLAGYTEYLSTPELAKAQIDQLLATGRHDVAVPGPVTSICAAVPMDRPLAVRGRWERDGRRIASTDLERREAPGFGECLTNDGEPLEEAAYQYIAADSDDNESAAGGIVLGAERIDQQFVNDGKAEVCAIRIAPRVTRYFEVYVYEAAPIERGAGVSLPVAAIEQDVETVGCDDEVLTSFSFDPDAGSVQSLAPS